MSIRRLHRAERLPVKANRAAAGDLAEHGAGGESPVMGAVTRYEQLRQQILGGYAGGWAWASCSITGWRPGWWVAWWWVAW